MKLLRPSFIVGIGKTPQFDELESLVFRQWRRIWHSSGESLLTCLSLAYLRSSILVGTSTFEIPIFDFE